jgi:hypothetical protein
MATPARAATPIRAKSSFVAASCVARLLLDDVDGANALADAARVTRAQANFIVLEGERQCVKKMNDDEIYLFNYVVRTIPKFLGTMDNLSGMWYSQANMEQLIIERKGRYFPNIPK